MKTLLWSAVALVLGLFAVLSPGCAVSAGAYGYDEGPGYYEASGVAYGSWGPGYRVGPVREDDHRGGPVREGDHRGGAPQVEHGARPGPAPRPVPSIPSGPRSGGGHGR